MEMRILRENIYMERLIGENQGQAVVEGEITLPGGLREEARVLQAGGMAVIQGAEALQDRASVMGKVVFHVLYTQGDPEKPQAIEASADFTHAVDMQGAAPKMSCHAQAVVEHVEAAAYNGRLTLKAILMISAQVISSAPVAVVTGVQDVPGLETETQTITLKRTVASGEGDALLREEFELADVLNIHETLYGTAQAMVTDVTGGQGKATVSGTVQLEVYHYSEMPSRPLVLTRHTLSFEEPMDLNGESGDQLLGDVVVKDVAVLSQDAGEGGRILRAEVLLGLRAWADRDEQATVLQDAYTTLGDDLRLTSQPVTYRTGESRFQTAESGKLMLMLPEGSPACRTVLSGFATPILTGKEQIGGRLTVEGMLEVTLLYMTDDSQVPVSISQEEPFTITFACEAADGDFLALEAGDVDVSAITSDRVEMKYIVRLSAHGAKSAQGQVVTDVESAEGAQPASGIALYFIQPGEGVWDIAKRYRVPREQLTALNPDLEKQEIPGKAVLIWRRAAEA